MSALQPPPPQPLAISVLIGTSVGRLLQVPKHHSYLRSAGFVGFRIYEELVAVGCISVRGVVDEAALIMGDGCEEGRSGTDSHYPLSISRIVVPFDAVVEIGIEFLERTEDNDYDPFCVVYTDEKLHATAPSSSRHHHERSPPRSCPHVLVSSSTSIQQHRTTPLIPDHMTIYSAKENSGTWDDITIEFDRGFELLTSIGKGLLGNSFARSIDLTNFCNVTNIGANFLGSCARLIEIDLSPLLKVTTVGSGFLERCAALTF
jgi:hypothetical protein